MLNYYVNVLLDQKGLAELKGIEMSNNNVGIQEYVENFASVIETMSVDLNCADMIDGFQVMASYRDNSAYGDLYTGRNAADIRDDDLNPIEEYANIRVLKVAEGNFGRAGTVLVGIISDDPDSEELSPEEQAAYEEVINLAWLLKRGEIEGENHSGMYI